MQDLVSASRAAVLIGISKPTVCKWARLGKLTPLGKLDGSAFVFDRQYIESKAAELKEEAALKAA